MRKRKIITVLLGTLVLFVWNAISWMVLPFHSNTLENIPEQAIDADILMMRLRDGVYHYPGLPLDNSDKAISEVQAKLDTGPRITLMVYKSGPTKLFDPGTFLTSLLLNTITVSLLLALVSGLQTKTLRSMVWNTGLAGMILVVVSDIAQMNWFMFPLDYTLINAFDKLISFVLLGLICGLYTFKIPNYKNDEIHT